MRGWSSIGLAVLAASTLAPRPGIAAEPSLPSTVIILDCSRSMGERLPAQGDGLSITRLDAAREAVTETLIDLAARGDYRVGLWLVGHRLAWEDKVEPGLIDQTEYLAQTNGFAVLKELVPGDDVERLRHVRPLRPDDAVMLSAVLQGVKPWGESPLYLATCRAIDEFGGPARADRRGIILITDGANEQWKPKYPRSGADVMTSYYRRHIPLHIIGVDLSAKGHAEAIAEFRELARRTGGSFQQVDSAETLARRLADTIKVISDPAAALPEEIAAEEVAPSEAPGQMRAVGTSAPSRSAAKSRVDGVVLFRGQPIKNATVKLSGARTVSVKTDKSGAFTFGDVPVGNYEVSVQGIAHNKIRDFTLGVKVEAPPRNPPYIEAELE